MSMVSIQSIETAPMDGSAFIGIWTNPKVPHVYEVRTVRFEPDGSTSFLTTDGYHTYFEVEEDNPPSYWVPLFEPPKE